MEEGTPTDNFDELLVLTGLEGNSPTTLNATQQVFVPYVDIIIILWWVVWLLMFFGMITKYIVIPLYKKYLKKY